MRLEEMPTLEGEIERLKQQLAECQTREKALRDAAGKFYDGSNGEVGELTRALKAALDMPSDSTALDTMLKQAKREALIDAAEQMESYCGPTVYYELHRMAKELEETK